MKKQLITIITIIILTAICLASCGTPAIKNVEINDEGNLIVNYENGETTDLGKVEGKSIESTLINDAGELIITYSDGTQENLGLVVSDNVWRDREDLVYARAKVNVRTQPTLESKVVGVLEFGQAITRIATNGSWNKIIYNDRELYVSATFTTPDLNEVEFETCESKLVYATENINLFLVPCVDEMTIATHNITVNTELIKVAENKNGTWIKVKHGDLEYYCRPSSVSDEVIKQQTVIPVT